MKLRTAFLFISLLVVAISAALSVRFSNAAKSKKLATDQANAAANDAAQQLAKLSIDFNAIENKQKVLSAALSGTRVTPKEVRKAQVSRFQQRLDRDPGLQVLKEKARYATINATHASLFRKLGLGEEKEEAFKKLLIDHEQDMEDLWASIREQGVPNRDPAVGKMVGRIESEFSENLRTLLGDQQFAQYKDNERSTLIRDMVAGIGGAATVAGEPIPADHLETLVKIMADSSPTYQKGGGAGPWEVDFELVDAQARLILSPTQYDIFTRSNARGPNLSGDRSGAELNQVIQKIIAQERMQSAELRSEPRS